MCILQRRVNHNEQRGTEHKEKDTQVDQNTTLVIQNKKKACDSMAKANSHTLILSVLFHISQQFYICNTAIWASCVVAASTLLHRIPNSLFVFSVQSHLCFHHSWFNTLWTHLVPLKVITWKTYAEETSTWVTIDMGRVISQSIYIS